MNRRKKESERSYIGRVTDEFAKEDLLVAVKGIDDEGEQLVDLSLESKGLCVRHSR